MTDVAPEEVEALVEQLRDAINTLYGNTDVSYSGSDEAHREGHDVLSRLHSLLLRAEEERDEAQGALADIHNYLCGCARPGQLDVCVAQPVVLFEALATPEETKEAGTRARA